MRVKIILLFLFIGMFVMSQVKPTLAQDTPELAKSSDKIDAFQLIFSLNELEAGKKVNTRHYSLILTTHNGDPLKDLKIGSRVPVDAGNGQWQYLDVGTSISSRLSMVGNTLSLDVHADISNFATADRDPRSSQPIIRQMVISGKTILVPGKTQEIGRVDDPSSNHSFQLEVTATKLN